MARARNIKPGFFKNEDLAECSLAARLCFAGLWTLADREGRLEDRPKRIKGELFPFDAFDVEPLLAELARHHFIVRYESDGVRAIQIPKFTDHQTPHYSEKPSVIKPPVLQERKPHHEPPKPIADAASRGGRNPLNPDSLIPDSRIPPPDGGGGGPAPGAAPPAPVEKQKGKKTAMPPGFGVSDRVKTWAEKAGFDRLDEHLEAFKRKCEAKGYTYANWDSALIEAIREDWAKLRGRTVNGAAPPPDVRKPTETWKPETRTPEQMAADRAAAAEALKRIGLTPRVAQ